MKKDLENKDRSNAVIKSRKYLKAKHEYQRKKKNNEPVNKMKLAKKYRINPPNKIYTWIERYLWDDLSDFVDVPGIVTASKLKELVAPEKKSNKKVNKEFLELLFELVKFQGEDGEPLTMEEIKDVLEEKGHSISLSYLYDLKNNNIDVHKIFASAGRIRKVEAALYKTAIGGKYSKESYQEKETEKGIMTTTARETVEKAGDVNAAKYILDKQGGKEWADKEEKQGDTVIEINIG